MTTDVSTPGSAAVHGEGETVQPEHDDTASTCERLFVFAVTESGPRLLELPTGEAGFAELTHILANHTVVGIVQGRRIVWSAALHVSYAYDGDPEQRIASHVRTADPVWLPYQRP